MLQAAATKAEVADLWGKLHRHAILHRVFRVARAIVAVVLPVAAISVSTDSRSGQSVAGNEFSGFAFGLVSEVNVN